MRSEGDPPAWWRVPESVVEDVLEYACHQLDVGVYRRGGLEVAVHRDSAGPGENHALLQQRSDHVCAGNAGAMRLEAAALEPRQIKKVGQQTHRPPTGFLGVGQRLPRV